MRHVTSNPIHPGEVLAEVYLKACEPPMTIEEVTAATNISPDEIQALLEGRVQVTEPLAARLAVLFHTTTDYWLGLQRAYDQQVLRAEFLLWRRRVKRQGRRRRAA